MDDYLQTYTEPVVQALKDLIDLNSSYGPDLKNTKVNAKADLDNFVKDYDASQSQLAQLAVIQQSRFLPSSLIRVLLIDYLNLLLKKTVARHFTCVVHDKIFNFLLKITLVSERFRSEAFTVIQSLKHPLAFELQFLSSRHEKLLQYMLPYFTSATRIAMNIESLSNRGSKWSDLTKLTSILFLKDFRFKELSTSYLSTNGFTNLLELRIASDSSTGKPMQIHSLPLTIRKLTLDSGSYNFVNTGDFSNISYLDSRYSYQTQGISNLKNLRYLSSQCHSNAIWVKDLPKLHTLKLYSCSESTVDLKRNPDLEYLVLNASVEKVDLTNCLKLRSLLFVNKMHSYYNTNNFRLTTVTGLECCQLLEVLSCRAPCKWLSGLLENGFPSLPRLTSLEVVSSHFKTLSFADRLKSLSSLGLFITHQNPHFGIDRTAASFDQEFCRELAAKSGIKELTIGHTESFPPKFFKYFSGHKFSNVVQLNFRSHKTVFFPVLEEYPLLEIFPNLVSLNCNYDAFKHLYPSLIHIKSEENSIKINVDLDVLDFHAESRKHFIQKGVSEILNGETIGFLRLAVADSQTPLWNFASFLKF
ncbi:hypothetical protein GEMRC1_006174 [Eukaryota sp. GEM-RC1]